MCATSNWYSAHFPCRLCLHEPVSRHWELFCIRFGMIASLPLHQSHNSVLWIYIVYCYSMHCSANHHFRLLLTVRRVCVCRCNSPAIEWTQLQRHEPCHVVPFTFKSIRLFLNCNCARIFPSSTFGRMQIHFHSEFNTFNSISKNWKKKKKNWLSQLNVDMEIDCVCWQCIETTAYATFSPLHYEWWWWLHRHHHCHIDFWFGTFANAIITRTHAM